MLFDLPSDDALYAALDARETCYDGRVFVGVRSTGIFCRLSCPARTPKRENCTFHESVAACLDAGFRPCKRCDPLGHGARAEPVIADLLSALEANPAHRWSETDITARGHDPSTVRRLFKRHYGLTFLEMARQRRLREGFAALEAGGQVIDAQLASGFDSPAAFRAAFARLLGLAPGALRKEARLRASWIESPLGPLLIVADDTHLHLLEFTDRKALPRELARLSAAVRGDLGLGRSAITAAAEAQLGAYFDGRSARFDLPLALHGTPFTRRVWHALQDIPAGETRSYGALAAAIGQPSASRAVARANGANQIAIVIPCHRIIGADGSLTGYGGGLWRKESLLTLERRYQETLT